jgi:hypothetical protein
MIINKVILCLFSMSALATLAFIADSYFKSIHRKKEPKPTSIEIHVSVSLDTPLLDTASDEDNDEWKYCANPDCGNRFVVVPSEAKRCAECGHSLQDYIPDEEEPLPTDFNERVFRRVHDLIDERIAAYQRLKFQKWCYENGKLTEFPDEHGQVL